MSKQRYIYYRCECGVKMCFYDGYIPERFCCTTCEKEYTAKDVFKTIKEVCNE